MEKKFGCLTMTLLILNAIIFTLVITSCSNNKDNPFELFISTKWDNVFPFNENVAFIEKDGRFGIIGSDGKVIVDPSTTDWTKLNIDTMSFKEGLAAIGTDEQGFGYINTKGEVVIPYKWTYAESFYDGYACVGDEDAYYIINKNGEVLFDLTMSWYDREGDLLYYNSFVGNTTGCVNLKQNILIGTPNWDYVGFFREGRSAVFKGEKWGFVDDSGKIIIEPIWDNVSDFYEGYAVVNSGGSWDEENEYNSSGKNGFINTDGVVVLALQWDTAYPFNKAGITAVETEQKWQLINKEGLVLQELNYSEVFPLEGTDNFLVKNGELFGIINSQGKIILNIEYDNIEMQDKTYITVKGDKFGVYNLNGDELFLNEWDNAFSENNIIVAVKDTNVSCSFIDNNGKIISDGWTSAIKFSGGFAAVNSGGSINNEGNFTGGKWGFINEAGELKITPSYDYIKSFSEGFAAVNKGGNVKNDIVEGGKWGYINENGELLGKLEWDYAAPFINGVAAVCKAGKWGFIKLKK
ncbi:MAG: repeat protein [Clostridia bacterium]|nr:repeat protein [Clostridia bacterium]